jgi:hypothetical protein
MNALEMMWNGRDRGLIEALRRNLVGGIEETHGNHQPGLLVSRARFEMNTSQIGVSSLPVYPSRDVYLFQ